MSSAVCGQQRRQRHKIAQPFHDDLVIILLTNRVVGFSVTFGGLDEAACGIVVVDA
jgi:hypothetical protein